MGWYTVTKRIKGHAYLYRQRTYRLGGRVHTESQYIGPASAGSRSSGGSANNSAASTSNNEQKPYEPSTVDDDFVNEPLAPRVWKNITDEQSVAPDEAFKSPRRRPVYSLDSPIASLRPGGTLKLKLPIKDAHFNSVVLRHEDIRVLKRMESMGIDTKNVPAIHITKGARVGGRRSLLSGTYLVSFPRSGGNRTLFKRQFRRTLAERWLHELESQDPFAFDHLRTEMDAGYRATKHALTGYLINTNVRGRWLLTLQVLWTRQMPEWLRQHVKPVSLGLVDHGPSLGWRDDATALMAEVMQRGYHATVKKYEAERRKATWFSQVEWRAYKKMGVRDIVLGRRRAQFKKAMRLQHRERALRAMEQKLSALRPLFPEDKPKRRRAKKKVVSTSSRKK